MIGMVDGIVRQVSNELEDNPDMTNYQSNFT